MSKYILAALLFIFYSCTQAQINRELVNAIKAGNTEQAKRLIDKEINLAAEDTAGYNYLHYTAEFNQQAIAEYLLQKGAEIDIKNDRGSTPLFIALLCKHEDISHYFLKKGANAHYIRNDGASLLFIAVQSNLYNTAKLLIEKYNVDVNHKHKASNTNAVNIAVSSSDYKMVKLLIENGADCNLQPNTNGITPLMVAAYYGKFDVLRLIVFKNPDAIHTVSPQYGTAKDLAVSAGHLHIAEFLIEPKFTIFDIMDMGMNTAVIDSIKQNNELALKRDANGLTLIHKAIYNFDIELLKQFIDNGLDPNIVDIHGRTPLLFSIHINNTEAAKYLVETGVNMELPDDLDYTPYSLAEIRDNNEILDLLKKKGTSTLPIRYKLMPSNPVQHTGKITSVCYSSDNKYALTASEDKTAILWDIASWKEIRTFNGHTAKIYSAVFSTDNKQVLTASADGTIKLWDIETGYLIRTFKGHKNDVVSAKFIADNTKLISASHDGLIIVWDMFTGEILKQMDGHTEWIRCLAVSENEKYAATGSDDKTLKIWDLETGIELYRFIDLNSEIMSVCFSPDNQFVLGGSKNGKIGKWNLQTGKLEKEIQAHNEQVNSLAFSPDDNVLLSSSNDYTAKFWNTNTFEQPQKELKDKFYINTASFSPEGNYILSSSLATLRLWDRKTSTYAKIFNFRSNGTVSNIQFIGGTNTFYAAHQGGIFLWDLENVKPVENQLENFEGARNILVNDEKLYADIMYFNPQTYQPVRELRVYDFDKRSLQPSINIETNDENNLFFSPKGNYAIYATDKAELSLEKMKYISDNSLQLLNIQTGEKFKKLKPHKGVGAITSACFTNDEKFVVTSASDSTISIWNIETGKETVIEANCEMFMTIKIDKNDNYIIAASATGEIELFDFKKQKSIKKIAGHQHGIWAIDFSNDNKHIVTGASDNTVKLWSSPDLELQKTFSGHNNWVRSVCFSPDDKFIISGSMDNSMKIWNIQSQKEIVSLYSLYTENTVYEYDSLTLKNIKFDKTYDFAAVQPNGFYYASKGALQALGFKYGTRAYTFDQFDLLYNRPDRVLKSIGYSNDTTAFRLAFEKRFEKVMDTIPYYPDLLNFPTLEIINKSEIGYLANSSTLKLNINAERNSRLEYLNIWVNNVPVYGIKGYELKRRNLDKEFEIELSQGINKIEVSVRNSEGLESVKERIEIAYKPAQPIKPDLYILGIGISEHKNYNKLVDVDNDIREFVKQMKKQESRLFNKVIVDTLLNSDATLNNIFASQKFLEKAKINDVAIVYYSGHGDYDGLYNYYLPTYEYEKGKFETTAMKYENLVALGNDIKVRKKLFLINACKSGEYDSDLKIFKQMQTLFTDLRETNGSIIISASGSQKDDYSYTGRSEYNGKSAFGKVLIDAISNKENSFIGNSDKNNDMQITVSELTDYLLKEVRNLTGRRNQQPTIRNENIQIDYPIWQ